LPPIQIWPPRWQPQTAAARNASAVAVYVNSLVSLYTRWNTCATANKLSISTHWRDGNLVYRKAKLRALPFNGSYTEVSSRWSRSRIFQVVRRSTPKNESSLLGAVVYAVTTVKWPWTRISRNTAVVEYSRLPFNRRISLFIKLFSLGRLPKQKFPLRLLSQLYINCRCSFALYRCVKKLASIYGVGCQLTTSLDMLHKHLRQAYVWRTDFELVQMLRGKFHASVHCLQLRKDRWTGPGHGTPSSRVEPSHVESCERLVTSRRARSLVRAPRRTGPIYRQQHVKRTQLSNTVCRQVVHIRHFMATWFSILSRVSRSHRRVCDDMLQCSLGAIQKYVTPEGEGGGQMWCDKVWQGRGSSATCDVTLVKYFYRPNTFYRNLQLVRPWLSKRSFIDNYDKKAMLSQGNRAMPL